MPAPARMEVLPGPPNSHFEIPLSAFGEYAMPRRGAQFLWKGYIAVPWLKRNEVDQTGVLLRQTLLGIGRARTQPGRKRNIRGGLLPVDFVHRRLQAEPDAGRDREIVRDLPGVLRM